MLYLQCSCTVLQGGRALAIKSSEKEVCVVMGVLRWEPFAGHMLCHSKLHPEPEKIILYLFLLKYLFLVYVYEYLACMNACVSCECSACGGQKRTSNPLELELQTAVSPSVGAEN